MREAENNKCKAIYKDVKGTRGLQTNNSETEVLIFYTNNKLQRRVLVNRE